MEQALAAVTARVEAIEAEAGQFLEHLRKDEEILADGRRVVEKDEADERSTLRREALMDLVARSEARRDSAGQLPE
ncbi:hypothetical protein ACQEV2_42185 [Streptomyces sp. CA-251387]|uniref:hypothetical protein n=1 Tax=Streptomyces sp. CA-251387 TaxID=3240064 RepID=UPI003D92F4D6